MAYSDIALLAADPDFATRTTACYAVESLDDDNAINAGAWQVNHAWSMAAQPGFGDQYASALANSVPRPGNDPSVISDAQILGAVQALVAADTPDPLPPEE